MRRVAVRVWRPSGDIAEAHSFLVGHAPRGISGVLGHVGLRLSAAEDGEPDSGSVELSAAADTAHEADEAESTCWDIRCAVETLSTVSGLGVVRRRNPLHTEVVEICNDLRASAMGRAEGGGIASPEPASDDAATAGRSRRVQYVLATAAAGEAACRAEEESAAADTARSRLRRRKGLPGADSSISGAAAAPVAEGGEGSSPRAGTARQAVPDVIASEEDERGTPATAAVFRDGDSALTVLLVPAFLVQ